MAHHTMMLLITLTTLCFASPTISIAPAPSAGGNTFATAPSPSSHKAYVFEAFKDLMCANYDPQATAESVKADPKLAALCDNTLNSAKCLDFLGNKPNADPAFAVKSDSKVVKDKLQLETVLARRTQVPELKQCFDTCATEFDKATKNLDNVEAACDQKVTKQATSLLGDVVSNLNACSKAFDGVPEIKKKYEIKDVNDGALEAINKIAMVAKKFNE
ncbi:hypothetical protein LINPERPRIM_LOCUS35802 [Linum perenne]